MFTPPRFVAVDDKPDHLQAILETFQQLGAPCIGIHYDPARDLEPTHFRGVRGLFLDLHLIEGAASTDQRRHYAQIAQILEDNISPSGGPFVLVIWTEHAHLATELTTYLDENLASEQPHARPLAVLSLAKEQFINTATGALRPAATLRQAVEQALTSNPQLAALIGWETDVLAAAGATLSALIGLVPAPDRTTATFPAALDALLSRIARESVGRAHVAADPRAAVAAVFAPILADRIVNQDVAPETNALWRQAITRHEDRALGDASPREAGQINRMLHVAVSGAETIRATDWGGVSEFPAALWTEQAVSDLFGVNIDVLLREEFKIRRPDFGRCRARLVRIGAACDHVQNRRGPLSFLFGIEIPVDVDRIKQNGQLCIPASEWATPILALGADEEAFRLSVNCRFGLIRPAAACSDLQPCYRLREQLMMHLISHANVYVARPGIVRL